MARRKKKDTAAEVAEIAIDRRARWHQNEFINLAVNAVRVDGLPDNIPENWVTRCLLYDGAVAFAFGEAWHVEADGAERTHYGASVTYRLIADDNTVLSSVPRNLVKLVKANPEGVGLVAEIRDASQTMARIENAIDANLVNSQGGTFFVTQDDAQVQTIRDAYAEMCVGVPAVAGSAELFDAIKAYGNNVPYMADRLRQLYTATRDAMLNRIGVLTANTDKREREQSAEIYAEATATVDFLYLMIDTFNKCAEENGLPYRMRSNSQVDELITAAEEREDETFETI